MNTGHAVRKVDADAVRLGVSLLDLLPPDAKVRRVGRDAYQALCSFHEDSRPSMSVRLTRSGWRYRCFACNEAGGVVDYVMATRRLSFRDALRALADGRAEFLAGAGWKPKRAPAYVLLCSTCPGRRELHVATRDEAIRAAVFAGWQLLGALTRCPWCVEDVLAWRERLSLEPLEVAQVERRAA